MAFSDYRYPDVITQLGLTETTGDLFPNVPRVQPSAALAASLPMNIRLATTAHTEASRSTWIVGPILADFWARYSGRVSLYAGTEFAADEDDGLTGYVDFIIGLSPQLPLVLRAPTILIFEAKRDSIPGGLAQCIAGMVGMQRYNARHQSPINPIYGCVTTGSLWKFLRLSDRELMVDMPEYHVSQLDHLLGILAFIVGPIPSTAAA